MAIRQGPDNFTDPEAIAKINTALENMWTELGWPKDFRYHRLMSELCYELCLSRM